MKLAQVIKHARTHVPTEADVVKAVAGLSPEARTLVDRFRRMVDAGDGGARGMQASTRREALAGFAHLLGTNATAAVALASTVSLAPKAQGNAVSELIALRRSTL